MAYKIEETERHQSVHNGSQKLILATRPEQYYCHEFSNAIPAYLSLGTLQDIEDYLLHGSGR